MRQLFRAGPLGFFVLGVAYLGVGTLGMAGHGHRQKSPRVKAFAPVAVSRAPVVVVYSAPMASRAPSHARRPVFATMWPGPTSSGPIVASLQDQPSTQGTRHHLAWNGQQYVLIPADPGQTAAEVPALSPDEERTILEMLRDVKAQVGDDRAVLRRELEQNARELVAEMTGQRPDDVEVVRQARRLVRRSLDEDGPLVPSTELSPDVPEASPVPETEPAAEADPVSTQLYLGPPLQPAHAPIARVGAGN